MTEFTYIPVGRVDVFSASELADLLQDEERLGSGYAFCLRRKESWSPEPMYYVFAREDLWQIKEEAPDELETLSRPQLFELLDVHEETRAAEVAVGAKPEGGRAVALDATGSVAGVWLEEPIASGATSSGAAGGRGGEPPPIEPNGGGAEERREDEEAATDPFFRRTPHMNLSEQEPLAPGQDLQAIVFLDTEGARSGETVREVVVDLPDDLETLDFEVMLAGTDHFEVTGESFKTLTIGRDDEESDELPFDVRVVDDPPLDQPASLTAYLTYNHRPSGRVQRAVQVQGTTPPVAEEEAEQLPVDELAIDGRAVAADITVEVVDPTEKGTDFLVTVRTTLVDDFSMTEPEPWSFKQQTDEYVEGMMEEFTDKDAAPEDRLASLEGAGLQLWDKAPKSFKDLFWRLDREGIPLRTIYIASEEPHIPWELMRPHRGRDDGTTDERNALGVDYVIGRWVDLGRRHQSPKQQVPIEDSFVLAPTKHRRPLKMGPVEADWVAKHFAGMLVDPAGRARLDAMLKERAVSLLHVIAHGKSTAKGQQFLVMDGNAKFTALQVGSMRNLKAAWDVKAPLVFLNACEIGRPTPALVGAGGFAGEFIKAGARCVVAPIWSVKDELAHQVALAFYEAALAEPERPFADILREIRARAYAQPCGEDTYAAYCFYGDPLTSLEPPA